MARTTPARRTLFRRSLVVFGPIVYAGVVSLRQEEGAGHLVAVGRATALFALACGLLLGILAVRRTNVFQIALAAFGVGLAAAPIRGPGQALAVAAAAVSAVVTLTELRRVTGAGGLGIARTRGDSGPTAVVFIASIAAAALYLAPARKLPWFLAPGWLDVTASLVAFVAIGYLALKRAADGRLDLGVPVRTLSAFFAVTALVLAGAAFALLGRLRPEPVLRLFLHVGTLLALGACTLKDPIRVVKIARRTGTLLLFGVPAMVAASLIGEAFHMDALVTIPVSCALVAILATFASGLEELFLPARGLLLDACASAEEVLLLHDPETATPRVLDALRKSAGPKAGSPWLYLAESRVVLSVDAAGYPREREVEIPTELALVLRGEPEAVLRIDVLRTLLVRRPDLRSLLRWMEDTEFIAAVLVVAEGEDEGILLVPRGDRTELLTLEEVRALKRLADRLAGACRLEEKSRRGREREMGLTGQVAARDETIAKLEQTASQGKNRHDTVTDRLARPAMGMLYAPASRLAYEAVEARVAADAPILINAPLGVDPIPYLARAHLGSKRKDGPFVIVDGAQSREHDLARWHDPRTSPVACADGGRLVLVDAPALPGDVQRAIAKILAERRAPGERADPIDVVLAVTVAGSPSSFIDRALLDAALVARLGDAVDHVVTLPRVAERPEDLRALLSDRLAREGLRLHGSPIGLDDAAFGAIVEGEFLGEDADLASLAIRLAKMAKGPVVTRTDVRATVPPPASAPAGPGAPGEIPLGPEDGRIQVDDTGTDGFLRVIQGGKHREG